MADSTINPENRKSTAGRTKGQRLATLLLSSAGPALAVALAGGISPAAAVTYCVITDTGAPWTIVCSPPDDSAANPNPPGTNSYNSGNLGLVVTVNPGVTITPDTGTWFFGNSSDGNDSGGPFVFTNGNATASSGITGNISVSGNTQLPSNSASFSNNGNITGFVALGTPVWLGGSVSFFNGPGDGIGGDVTVLSGATSGTSGAQNFDNEGSIGGSVLLSTAGSNISTSSAFANVTGNVSGNTTTTTSVVNSSSSFTHNGGPITAVNGANATVAGSFNIFANAGASLNNSGVIGNNVNVIDTVTDTASTAASGSVDSFTFQVGGNSSTANVAGGNVVTTVGNLTLISSGTTSSTSTTTFTSAGSDASLVNQSTGTIGNSSGPLVFVVVNGDNSANANNAGNIFGNVLVKSFSSVSSDTVGSAFSSATALNTTFTTVVDNFTSPPSSFIAYSATTSNSSTTEAGNTTHVTTLNYTAGNASLVGGNAGLINSGKITGSVTVSAADTASLTNTGTIFDPAVIANAFNVSTVSSTSFGCLSAFGSTSTYTGDNSSAGNFIQSFANSSMVFVNSSTAALFTSVSSAVGGTASLVNSGNGTIGGNVGNSTIYPPVTVIGQASANLTNTGTIFSGNILDQAEAFTAGTTSASNFASAVSVNSNSYVVVNTGNNTAMGAGGTILAQGGTDSVSETIALGTSHSNFVTFTGGAAQFNNTGVIDPAGGTLSVIGVSSAVFANTGNITESNVNVLATVTNTAFSTATNTNIAVNVVNTFDQTVTFAGNATVTSTNATGNVSSASAVSVATTRNLASAGGAASLTNSGLITGNGSFVNVSVVGDSSATLVNTGSINLLTGNNSNTLGGVAVRVQSLTGTLATSAGCMTTFTTADVNNLSSIFVNTGNASPNFWQTSVTNDVNSFLSSSGSSFTSTANLTGGVAQLTNGTGTLTTPLTGNITGSVTVVGVIGASLTNSGFIGASKGSVDVFASQSADTTSGSFLTVFSSGHAFTASLSGNLSGNFTLSTASSFNSGCMTSRASSFFVTSTGGNASLVNTGNIGLSGKGMSVMVDADGISATAINSGTIFGPITVVATAFTNSGSSADSTASSTSVASTAFTTVNTSGNVVTVFTLSTLNTSHSSVSSDSSSFTSNVTGGIASLTNTGNITGDAFVYGNASATLINTFGNGTSGAGNVNIFGNVRVDSTAINTTSADSQNASSIGNSSFASSSALTSDTVAGTFTQITGTTFATNNVFSQGHSSTSVEVSNATTATLQNDGTIGTSKNPVNVVVVADGTAATAINTGVINGNLSVHAFAFSNTSLDTSSYVSATASSSSTYIQTASGGNVVIGNLIIPNVAYTPSRTSASSSSWTIMSTGNVLTSSTVTGGVANATNSGKIVGSVDVSGPAGASLSNNGKGNITGMAAGQTAGFVNVFSTGNNTVSASSFTDTSAFAAATSTTFTQVQTLANVGNVGNVANVTAVVATTYGNASTFNDNSSHSDTSASSFSRVSSGTTASLVNSTNGTIGLGNSSFHLDINVIGNSAASVTNSGLVWVDNLHVIAPASSFSTTSSDTNTASFGESASSSSSFVNTGNAITSYMPSSTASFLFASSGGCMTSARLTQTNLGGTATLTNNASGVLIAEDLRVYGGSSASVVNSGVLGPEVNGPAHIYDIISAAKNFTETSASGCVSTGTLTTTFNESATLSGVTLTTTNNSASVDSFASTSSSAYTLAQLSSGGNASLVNNSTGVIGGYPVTINVFANQVATVSNSGEIDGNVSVKAIGHSLNSADSTSTANNSTQSFANTWTTVRTDNITIASLTLGNGTVFANLSFSSLTYTSTMSGMESSVTNSASTYSNAYTKNAVSGVASLTNAASASITGNVTVSAPYGATLVNSGTIGGSPLGIGQMVLVSGIGANVTDVASGNVSRRSVDASTFTASTTLGADNNLTSTYNNVGNSSLTSAYFHTATAVTTHFGAGATLTNNAGATIGTLANPMVVVVDSVGPSIVTNNGNIYGTLDIGANQFGSFQTNTSRSSVDAYSAISSANFSNQVGNVTLNPWDTANITGSFNVVVLTSFTNTATTAFSTSSTTAHSSVTTTVAGPASYTGSGNVYGSLQLFAVSGVTLTNTGTLGSPTGGGSVNVESFGTQSSESFNQLTLTSGGTTDANVSSNGTTATETFNGSSTTTSTFSSSSSLIQLGGNASLINSGTIGGTASNPINVFVSGTTGAFANNTGTILGSLDVESSAFNTSSSTASSDAITRTSQSVTQSKLSKGSWVLVSKSSTSTSTESSVDTSSSQTTSVGGNVTVLNSGNITGGVKLFSGQNALLQNGGLIEGFVQLTASADNSASNSQANFTQTIANTFNGNATVNTSTTVNTFSVNELSTGSIVSVGGNSTLVNTGSIGLRVVQANGNSFIQGNPSVLLIANQNASVTNAAGANILGSVTERVNGISAVSSDSHTASAKTNSVTTVVPSIAGNGSVTTTLLTFTSVGTENFTSTSAETGGTATLLNNGNIGQRFAPSFRSGGCITGGGGVSLTGEKGATITNNGLIGLGAEAYAEASTTTVSFTSVDSTANTTMIVAVSNSLTNTATTTTTLIQVLNSTNTTVSTPTGGSATIINSATGVIGVDVLSSTERPVASGANVIAAGQAGALINNAGLIQASLVSADSTSRTTTSVDITNSTLTYSANSAIGMSLSIVGGTSVNSVSVTALAGGGTATIINSGRMLSSNDVTFDLDGGTLQVIANSFGNATITNQKGAVIVGDVAAYSGGNSTTFNGTTTTTFNQFGTTTQVETQAVTGKWSGGTAFVDNAGNIGGYVGASAQSPGTLIGGDVLASGVTMGKVLNETGATIFGSASASSVFGNYAFNSTVTTTTLGPAATNVFVETVSATGGTAILDNFGTILGGADAGRFNAATNFSESLLFNSVGGFGSWGGANFANLTNEQGAFVQEDVSANSLFIGLNNNNGNVTSPLYGGFATVINNGIVGGGFSVTSLKGSTLINAANSQIGSGTDPGETPDGDEGGFMLTIAGTSNFQNFGTIGAVAGNAQTATQLYVNSLLGPAATVNLIEFMGNTTAVNTGIITDDLIFTNVAGSELNPSNLTANATFTFGQGSVLTGSINSPFRIPGGESLSNLTLNFSGTTGGGIYQGNIYGASATNVTAPGRWILTGNALGLGTTTINNPVAGGATAWLQIGTPLNFFLNNPAQLLDVILGQNLDPLEGLDPFAGNTAVNPALNSVSPSLTSGLIAATKNNPVVTGNINIGTNGGLEGQAVIVGSVSNSGFLLPGWMLPNNTSATLVNLIANTNQILPGRFEISNNFTQSSTGTFLTNVAPAINRPAAKLVGTQAGPFAPVSFWLSVAPFQADNTPTGNVVVDGNATVNGAVQVYVNTGGLYVNGDSRTIVFDKGNLTLSANATTTQSFPSQFVHFGLATGNTTVSAVGVTTKYNTLNVVVQRTSYASVATTPNSQAVGVALDSAVTQVANEITGANGFVFANMTQFNNAQDMAGFLSDLDWRSGNVTQAAAILSDVTPSGYSALLAIDTGIGFRNQVNNHLLDNRGAGAVGDPLVGSFIQAYGMSQRVNSNNTAQGVSGNTAGISAGIDFAITDAVTLGAAMGWSNTSLGGNQVFGGGLNAIQAGIYGTVALGGFYLDATVWENFVHGSTHRSDPLIDRAFNASYRDDEFRADAELGYRFNFIDTYIDNLGVTPYVGFSYRGVNLGNFSETAVAVSPQEVPDGALGVTVKTQGHDIMQPDLGVTVDGLYRISPMVTMKPMVGIGVGFGNAANNILAAFEGGGQPFVVKGPLSNSAFFTPEAGLQFQIGPTYSLSFTYRGAIGGKYEEEGGWLTLRGTW